MAGLGFADGLDEERLAAIERAFAERGASVQAEVAVLGDPSVSALLTRRGYVLENFENVLGLRLPAANLPAIGAGYRRQPPNRQVSAILRRRPFGSCVKPS